MSNHYHLLVGFEAARKLSREELRDRATLLYPDPEKVLKNDQQWERFNRRLFDLSELMRNIQSAFTKWYNRCNGRRGSLWDGRFRSTIPLDPQAVQETLAYIELNPVRAGLVSRPEDYMSSSAFLRHIGADDWLMPIGELFEGSDQMQSYRGFLYYRGFEGGSREAARRGPGSQPQFYSKSGNVDSIGKVSTENGCAISLKDWYWEARRRSEIGLACFNVVVDIYGGAIRSRTWMALPSRFASSVLSRKPHPADPLESARDHFNFKRLTNLSPFFVSRSILLRQEGHVPTMTI